MFKLNPDYKSRFRILKGGKISLVVSALVVGSLTSTAQATPPPTNYYINDANTTAIVLNIPEDTVTITNSGSLTVTDANSTIYRSGDFNGTIENAGDINQNYSAKTTTSGIYIENMGNASIDNSGTIDVNNSFGAGYGIYITTSMENSTITNTANGNIEVNTNADAFGISVTSMDAASTITNEGTISVNAVNTSKGIFSTGQGTIINSGTISATRAGIADRYGYSVDSSADVNNTSTGKLYGNLKVTGTLTNEGLVSLPYNSNNGEDATVTNFVQTATGKLEIGLLTDGSTTNYAHLQTANASFADGSTIAVNVLAASTNQALIIGQTLTDVVKASTHLTIGGTLNITDNSALLNFELNTTNYAGTATLINGEDGAIHLNIVEGSTIADAAVASGGNKNTQAAAKALDTIKDGTYPAMAPFIGALNGLATDKEVADAVASTTPVAATAAAGAASQVSNGVQGIVEMRQRANLRRGLNSGEEVFGEKSMWLKPFGSFGKQDDKGGMNGFDINAKGLGFGFEGEYAANQKVGLALFYADANVDVNNMTQSSDLGVFTTLVYGNIPFLDDKTNFLYQVGYAWQKTNSDKRVVVGALVEAISADYTSTTASIDLKVMRDYEVNSQLLLQPIVSTTYRNFTSPSYTETGGTTALSVDKYNTEEFIIGVGTLAHYKLDDVSKITANVNVGYDVSNNQQTITSSYAGASGVKFDTNGIDNGRWKYNMGIGYERDVKEGQSINFSYNYQAQGTSFENHVLSAKYVYTF